ncbi:MAG: hypothetical protein QOJ63_1972, partial [Solirubrobacteraceae bacterium]|nr:hypothetical protein [Solirubrobacteraceae bacterium]
RVGADRVESGALGAEASMRRAITPLTPESVERIRATLLDQGRERDATLVSVLAYTGVRPQEAVALRWRQAEHAADRAGRRRRRAQGQKTNRPPRTVTLLAPLREDLAVWRTEQSPRATRCSSFAPRTASRGASTTGATGGDGASGRRRAPPASRTRVHTTSDIVCEPAHPRGAALDRGDCGAARAQPDHMPVDVRARDRRAAGGAVRSRGGADPACSRGRPERDPQANLGAAQPRRPRDLTRSRRPTRPKYGPRAPTQPRAAGRTSP